MRMALGRSHDLPPDWDALTDQYVRVCEEGQRTLYRCIDEDNEISFGHTFDEKGRPYNRKTRELAEKQANASDIITEHALRLEIKQGEKTAENSPGYKSEPHSPSEVFGRLEVVVAKATAVGIVVLDTYLSSVAARSLARKPFYGVPFTQIFLTDLQDRSYLVSLSAAAAIRWLIYYVRPRTRALFQPLGYGDTKGSQRLYYLTLWYVLDTGIFFSFLVDWDKMPDRHDLFQR